jgi:hypothetical protein
MAAWFARLICFVVLLASIQRGSGSRQTASYFEDPNQVLHAETSASLVRVTKKATSQVEQCKLSAWSKWVDANLHAIRCGYRHFIRTRSVIKSSGCTVPSAASTDLSQLTQTKRSDKCKPCACELGPWRPAEGEAGLCYKASCHGAYRSEVRPIIQNATCGGEQCPRQNARERRQRCGKGFPCCKDMTCYTHGNTKKVVRTSSKLPGRWRRTCEEGIFMKGQCDCKCTPTYFGVNDLEREQQQMQEIQIAKLVHEYGLCFAGQYGRRGHTTGQVCSQCPPGEGE